MILIRSDIIQYFRVCVFVVVFIQKQFQLLRRIECEYFDIKIQTCKHVDIDFILGFDWYTKRTITEENTIQEVDLINYFQYRQSVFNQLIQKHHLCYSVFRIYKKKQIPIHVMIPFIGLSLDENVSDVIKEMQNKWKNIAEETQKVNDN